MDHYFLNMWAVERHMRSQFDPDTTPEPEKNQPRRKPGGGSIRHRLGRMLYALAEVIDPVPTTREQSAS